ncbi:hypothetical protein [Bacillus mobilis]
MKESWFNRFLDKVLLSLWLLKLLAPFIIIIAFIAWIFWPEDPYEKYYEDHDNNPYNQDFNGDGWKGTKEDHDVYHKYLE